MPVIHEDECIAARLDPKEVSRIARGIERYGKQAAKLGIELFGGSGTCTMRFADEKANESEEYGKVIVAVLHGFICDGGDGGEQTCSPDKLHRGEA